MAVSKSAKIEAEIEKVKAKIAEQQAKLKELEQRKIEAENSEIVEMVRGMSVSLTELPLLLEKLRSGQTPGQIGPVDKVPQFTQHRPSQQEKRRPVASFRVLYHSLEV